MAKHNSVPPGRESLHNAVLEASELRNLVAEQKVIDQGLKDWRQRMIDLLGNPETGEKKRIYVVSKR